MDSPTFSWISEMGLDSSIFTDQSDFMDSIDEELAAVLGRDIINGSSTCLSPKNNSSSTTSSTLINIPSTNSINSLCVESPPTKLQKPNDFSNFSSINNKPSSNPIILNFENTTPNPQAESRILNPDEEAAVTRVLKSHQVNNNNKNDSKSEEQQIANAKPHTVKRVRPPSQTYDHIIAERKRREQLSQRFVVLSTIVPGLKKMDKTSVLGDAIKYLKQLQERVKMLEEQATRQTMESVVLVKKSRVAMDNNDEGSSEDEMDEHPLPEIEARICNNNILIRVHCEKQKGVLVNLLGKIEKFHLCVLTTNVTPFGNFTTDITVIAEMEKEFCLTGKEVVKRLRAALRHNG